MRVRRVRWHAEGRCCDRYGSGKRRGERGRKPVWQWVTEGGDGSSKAGA